MGLEYSAAIAPALGLMRKGSIVLLPGLSPAEEFSTLVHKLAQEILHVDRKDSSWVRETEAETVAFVVCEASAGYIQLHQGNKAPLLASFVRIRAAAWEVIEGLEFGEPEAAGRVALRVWDGGMAMAA
ncbi:MAG: hypothetical protein J5J06_14830 [Phycisphaerae bacterium]|nr:hypothetical protein [Phycisphaerae bacterium]